MKYSIIIPAYNEEGRIGHTIDEYASYIQHNLPNDETELIVIVNGSHDRTGEITREKEKLYPFMRMWETPERQGKGGAVLKGFDMAKGEIVSFTDADNSTVPEELIKLIRHVEAGSDAAIGSRWLPTSVQSIPQPFSRRLASRVFNMLVRILFQFPYKDTQCGAKAFRKQAIQTVWNEIKTKGWAFDVELIWTLRRHGFKVDEVPIIWRDNSKSRLRMHRDAPAMLYELLKIRFGF